VIYVAAEAGNTIRQRIAAWKIEHGYESKELPFAVVPHAVDLCHAAAGECDALIEKIRDTTGAIPVALVVIDTVNRALGGGNENGPEDMGAFSRSLDRFRDELQCHVLGVHHCGKNPALGARGHSLLIGNVDTEIEVAANDATKTSTVTMHKQRDAELTPSFSFSLKPVILGTNQVGQIITSCIVMPSDIEPSPKAAKPKRSSKTQIAFDALVKAIDSAGTTPPPSNHLPLSARGVSIELWRDYYYAMVPAADEKEKAMRKSAFWRARGALQGETPPIAVIWNEYAWIVPR
jgi:RecA-family ATPase